MLYCQQLSVMYMIGRIDIEQRRYNGKQRFTAVGQGLLIRAPAKINLSLLIAGKRPDGFHEIETVMAKINWFDEILIEHARKKGIEVISTGPYWAPQGKENLIYKACRMLLDACDSKANLKITLTKNIPAGSGLGSASSDAAATLVGVKKFLGLDVTIKQMREMAALLGSDVAFFLAGPLSFCRGKGEKITRLNKKFDFDAILILPDVSVSTKKVYSNYIHDKSIYKKLSPRINRCLEKNRVDLIAKIWANMLAPCCFRLHTELAELKSKVESWGLRPLCLSGSGSTLYYIMNKKAKANLGEYQQKIGGISGCKSIVVSNNRW